MKTYITTIISDGYFNGWSSRLCSVKVGYKPEKDKIFFIKIYKQEPKNNKRMLSPYFSPEQKERIKEKAKWNYETFILGKNKDIIGDKKIHINKHHLEDKCERCIELGSYCKNGKLFQSALK